MAKLPWKMELNCPLCEQEVSVPVNWEIETNRTRTGQTSVMLTARTFESDYNDEYNAHSCEGTGA